MAKYILFGPDGSGKTTTAKALKGYEVRSFADPIKKIVHTDVGREPMNREDKEKNFRDSYIAVGNRGKELYGDDVWAKAMDYSGENVVIDDGRFLCEYEEAIKHGFIPVLLWPGDYDSLYMYDLDALTNRIDSDYILLEWGYIDDFISKVNFAANLEEFIQEEFEKDEDESNISQSWLGVLILVLMIIGLATVLQNIANLIFS